MSPTDRSTGLQRLMRRREIVSQAPAASSDGPGRVSRLSRDDGGLPLASVGSPPAFPMSDFAGGEASTVALRGPVKRISQDVGHSAKWQTSSTGTAVPPPTDENDAAGRVLPWDDPDYWAPVSDAAIDLAARTFRRHLAEEPVAPSPRHRWRNGPFARPA